MKRLLTLSYLIPSKIHNVNTEMLFAWQADFRNELETPMELEQEVMNCFIIYYLKCNLQLFFEWNIIWIIRWKRKYGDGKKTLQQTLDMADSSFFPNISILLEFLLTVPVGSCSCERLVLFADSKLGLEPQSKIQD